jgi:hypothetical protein
MRTSLVKRKSFFVLGVVRGDLSVESNFVQVVTTMLPVVATLLQVKREHLPVNV